MMIGNRIRSGFACFHAAADCVVIVTNHSSYDYGAILADSKLIVDTRNALGEAGRCSDKVVTVVMATYLVTGAAGFIAKKVCAICWSRGILW
jgi:hypothetical protein